MKLVRQLTTCRLGNIEVNVVANKSHDIEVAHMLCHVAHKLSKIGARLDVVGRPAEAVRNIAFPNKRHDLGHVVRIDGTEQAFGACQRNLPVLERNDLLERCERIAQPTFSAMRDQVKRLTFELDVFGHADGAQTRDHRLGGDATEIESLATRMNRLGDFLRIGRAKDEDHMRGRLLERLEKRVERRRREHVDLVDDVDLVAPTRWRELNAADNLLAHVLDTRAACSVELVHVGMRAFGNQQAVAARAIGVGSGALFA